MFLHTDALTRRCLYTQMLLRTGTFGQRELFPRGGFTHESLRDKSGTRKSQFMVIFDDDDDDDDDDDGDADDAADDDDTVDLSQVW